ncbi:hypothetical protein JXM67_04630 [candidate division WOR-3 bacterium]|nr:hypothetical protein [candidate division WOR-3 bacterium]
MITIKYSPIQGMILGLVLALTIVPFNLGADSREEEHAAELVQMAETRFSDGRTDAGLKICDMVLEKYSHTRAATKAAQLKRMAESGTSIVTTSPTSTSFTPSSGEEEHARELLEMAQTRLSDGRTDAGLKILDMIIAKYANTSSGPQARALKSKYGGTSSTTPVTTITTSTGGSRTEEEHAAELVEMAETRLADGRTEAAVKICDMVLEKYSHTRSATKAKELKRIAERD